MTDSTEKLIAHYVKVVYLPDNQVEVKINDDHTSVMFKRRKSWSHKKYVDKAMEEIGAKPGPFMSYGWDMTAL